jgi:DNA-directed RNA polymerase specialized sigma24 family protein
MGSWRKLPLDRAVSNSRLASGIALRRVLPGCEFDQIGGFAVFDAKGTDGLDGSRGSSSIRVLNRKLRRLDQTKIQARRRPRSRGQRWGTAMKSKGKPCARVELAPITIQRALEGDRAAFARLYRHYRSIVRGAVAARVRAWPTMTSHMDDILGDVWVQMLADDRKALRCYDPRRGAFAYFIKLLAASRASSVIRRRASRKRQPVPVETGTEDQIEHVLLQRNFLETLWASAQPLIKDVDEELFVRVMVMGRETKEVALELGLGQDAAYQRITRLRDKLVCLAGKLRADERGPTKREGMMMSDLGRQLRTDQTRNAPCPTTLLRYTAERSATSSRGTSISA